MRPRPQPQDLPEVTHLQPVPDSRGLVLGMPDDLAWTPGRHSLPPAPDGDGARFTPEDAPGPELQPCYLCGKPVRPRTPPPRYEADVFAICPLEDNLACLDRAEKRDKEEAQRSAKVAAAAVEGSARARQDAPEAPAADGEAPGEAGEPAPVAAKTPPRTRPSRARAAALDKTREKPSPA